jgi:hypothetical protein
MTEEYIEVEFEDARKGIKFKVKGTPDAVEAALKRYGYIAVMEEAAKRAAEPKPISTENNNKISNIDDIPEKPQAETITGYITTLIYSPWGSSGRKASEIIEVAKVHGLAFPMSTLAGILNGLVKTNKLRRIRNIESGQWVYYPPTSIAMRRE